jgi:uncharacterized membrane protein YciS (DUF1049 family)
MRTLSRWISTSAFIVVAVISVLAVIDNRSLVALRFLGWSTPELSLYWWLVAAFVLGVTVGWLGAGVRVLRANAGNRRLQRDLRLHEIELARIKGDTANP